MLLSSFSLIKSLKPEQSSLSLCLLFSVNGALALEVAGMKIFGHKISLADSKFRLGALRRWGAHCLSYFQAGDRKTGADYREAYLLHDHFPTSQA